MIGCCVDYKNFSTINNGGWWLSMVKSANGSCCDIKGNSFTYASNLIQYGDCKLAAEGYCDAATDGEWWLVIQ